MLCMEGGYIHGRLENIQGVPEKISLDNLDSVVLTFSETHLNVSLYLDGVWYNNILSVCC